MKHNSFEERSALHPRTAVQRKIWEKPLAIYIFKLNIFKGKQAKGLTEISGFILISIFSFLLDKCFHSYWATETSLKDGISFASQWCHRTPRRDAHAHTHAHTRWSCQLTTSMCCDVGAVAVRLLLTLLLTAIKTQLDCALALRKE